MDKYCWNMDIFNDYITQHNVERGSWLLPAIVQYIIYGLH